MIFIELIMQPNVDLYQQKMLSIGFYLWFKNNISVFYCIIVQTTV